MITIALWLAYLMTSLMLFMDAAMLVFSRSSFVIDESCPSSLWVLEDCCINSMLSRFLCTVACGYAGKEHHALKHECLDGSGVPALTDVFLNSLL